MEHGAYSHDRRADFGVVTIGGEFLGEKRGKSKGRAMISGAAVRRRHKVGPHIVYESCPRGRKGVRLAA
jgi:hypothetical protein